MNKIIYILLILALCACKANDKTEKYQNDRDNIINVTKQIKEISLDDILIGKLVGIHLLDNFLIVADYSSIDTLVHIFDKSSFSHLKSFGCFGEGPNEITNMGHLAIDEMHHKLHIPDWGKRKIFCYDIDSVLTVPSYMPQMKIKIGEMQFPDIYKYFSDTFCVARVVTKIKGAPFQQSLAFWNMNAGELDPMKYTHPKVENKRAMFAVSEEKKIIVEAYEDLDLITICDFSGNLKYNIYGPDWDSRSNRNIHYFDKVVIYKNKIIVGYSGNDYMTAYDSTSFLVFDLDGNYNKTLEVGYKFQDYCIDEANNRIIIAFSDEIQFGYLSLDNLLD